MKTYRKLLILGIFVPLFISGNLDAANLYGLGEQFGWDTSNPPSFVQSSEPGVFVIEKEINFSTDNKQFKFTLDMGTWDQVRYLVPNAVNYNSDVQTITAGSEYDMFLCSQSSGNLLDHFWGIPSGTDGYYRLIVNTNTMKLKVEMIPYIVGSAVFCDWDLGQVPRLSPNGNNTFTYTGWFSADQEFKFQTKPDWGSISLRNGAGSTGYITNGSGTLVVKQGDTDDWKFKLSESGNYKIICDLNAMTITAQKVDYQTTQIKYPALYLIGSATPGDWSLLQTTPIVWQENNTYSAKVTLSSGGTFKITTDPYRNWDNNFFFFKDASNDGKLSTDATNDQQWSISQTGDYIVSVNLEDMSINIRKYNVCSSTGNWTNTSNWSFGSVPTSSDIVVVNSGELTVDQTANAFQVKVLPGAKLTVNESQSLTVSDSLIIESDASGTATFVNKGTSNITKAIVKQYLPSARNWYISSPVSAFNVPVGSTYFGYQEAGDNTDLSVSGASAYWKPYAAGSSMTVGKGFIAQPESTTTLTFDGSLNDSDKTINLTRTSGKTKEGFNLIGNPYPSYVNWELATKTNVGSTIWYRTKNQSGTYVFDTFNGTGTNNNGSGAVTGLIPPMQAVWVRVVSDQTSGNVMFNNNMRSHATGITTSLKVPALVINQILRLQVSNGLNSDEAIIVFNPNASNSFDKYDSEKMTNNNVAIPEIYTTPVSGKENLVINGLESVSLVNEVSLGFSTGETNNFTIRATEMSNFDIDTHIILKDNLLHTETDLTAGSHYSFASDATSNSDRFTIVFKSSDVAAEINTKTYNNIWVSTNANNQVVINGTPNGLINVVVYNAIGQKLVEQKLSENSTVIQRQFQAGIYLITTNNAGDIFKQKVLIR
ncbi:MAG: SusF/SusE family outer membrane protein [Paludibacter sp.]|nr:SusF/SusE family outer membrane protein [Paludibacter sp.]